MRPFRDQEDYTHQEKQRVVLKALLLTACIQQVCQEVRDIRADLYHHPLMLVLVNSVNPEDADLFLFFRELERIARGDVDEALLDQARRELEEEFARQPSYLFERMPGQIDQQVLMRLTYSDLLRLVFHAERGGELEVLVRPSNRQELAFKVKTADRPFALIKIGDISGWLRGKLTGYEVNERFQDESFFARLNEDDSDITILMGSRTFYEGWDSNRPNVICYINIGVGEDAQKFILQSIGRGVRIEPLPGERQRLTHLINAGKVSGKWIDRIRERVPPIETLFVFATNRPALQKVVEGLQQERARSGVRQLSLFEVNPRAQEQMLLIPVYRESGRLLAEQRQPAKFEIDREEFEVLRQFVEKTDDRVLLALYEHTSPRQVQLLRATLRQPDEFYRYNGRKFGRLPFALKRVLDYLGVLLEQVEGFKELGDEIQHFRHISVVLEAIDDDGKRLQDTIRKIKAYRPPEQLQQTEKALMERMERGEISFEEFAAKLKELTLQQMQTVREERVTYGNQTVCIKHVAQHYYLPIAMSESARVDWLQHIISTPSEVNFVKALEQYVEQPGNRFGEFDWWLFSKLDETVDAIYLPYYDPMANRIAKFKPDFIFWLTKADDYFIVFVDPKGTEHRDADRKLEGYRMVFEEVPGQPRVIPYTSWRGRVFCFLWT
ncbi:MAG: restriction endonuclease subunit R, partial [Anaerolineae bacterium]